MSHELEYIVDQAIMLCDEGIKPDYFNGTHNANVKINGCKVCTTADKISITNIPTFGICQKTQKPCLPIPLEWKDTYKVKVKGNRTLLFKSTLPCGLGGKIEFITSGQIPISQEDLDKLTEENAEEPPQEEDDGLSWWDAVELVPFVGGVVGMVRSGIKGDWVGFGINAFSLVLDIGGLFTGGAGNVASSTIKGARIAGTGIKAASKTTNVVTKVAKAALTAGGKLLTKASAKAAAKALAKKADDIAIKYGKVCVFACFPAGTPIHTQQGIRKIEQIREGDLVWSEHETSGQISLKKVIATIRKEIDTTVQIELEGETIETTAEHPFYTQEGWKDAADLTEQDHIQTKNKKWYRVKGQNFLYTKKKVYNFEVEDWHTYFVGKLAWLVHNAKPCVSGGIKKTIKDPVGTFRDINGRLHNSKTGRFVKDPNKKIKAPNYRRNMEERRKALLRDAKDPKSGLSNRARRQILDSKGKRVPKGYEVSHEKPLYTGKTNDAKKKLDKMENMKTQQKSVHRNRHKLCGDQYHEFGPANNPKPDKMID